jgi:hypothetical protein
MVPAHEKVTKRKIYNDVNAVHFLVFDYQAK